MRNTNFALAHRRLSALSLSQLSILLMKADNRNIESLNLKKTH